MYSPFTVRQMFPELTEFAKSPVSLGGTMPPTLSEIDRGMSPYSPLPSQYVNYYFGLITKFNNLMRKYLVNIYEELDSLCEYYGVSYTDGEQGVLKKALDKVIGRINERNNRAPIGTIIMTTVNNFNPDFCLLLHGQSFDRNTYPELYAVLGTNKLPDFRRHCPVGAGYNASNYAPNSYGNTFSHDQFTLFQTKFPSIKDHKHEHYDNAENGTSNGSNWFNEAGFIVNASYSELEYSAPVINGVSGHISYVPNDNNIMVNFYIISR